MAKRPCYQCDDDLDEIRDRRNAEIRAWGRQQLADADAALINEPGNYYTKPVHLEPDVVEVTEPEPELTLSEPLDVIETSVEEPETPQPEAPKAPKTPKTVKPTTS